MVGNAKTPAPVDSGKALSGILALLVADREEKLANGSNDQSPRKTEIVLKDAGLNAAEIAPLVGKNLETVRKTLQRGKGK